MDDDDDDGDDDDASPQSLTNSPQSPARQTCINLCSSSDDDKVMEDEPSTGDPMCCGKCKVKHRREGEGEDDDDDDGDDDDAAAGMSETREVKRARPTTGRYLSRRCWCLRER